MTRKESAKVEIQTRVVGSENLQYSPKIEISLDTMIRCSDIKILWTLRRTFVTDQMFNGNVAIFAVQILSE